MRWVGAPSLVGSVTGGSSDRACAATGSTPATGHEVRDVLDLAGALERGSEHPLGAAILARAREDELGFGQVSGFAAIAGGGVEGTVEGDGGSRSALIGSRR